MEEKNGMFKRTAMVIGCGILTAACSGEAPEPQGTATGSAAAVAQAQAPAGLTRQPSPAGAQVYFIEPSNGAAVSNPVRVVFGLRGAGVAPAGVIHENTGHHHLLVNADVPPLDLPIPADERHVHFGLGQTEATLTLPPGEHRLQLLMGDHLHIPHDPPLMSEVITIRVQE